MCLNRFCNQFVNLVFKLTTDFESLLKSFTCLKVQKPAVNGWNWFQKVRKKIIAKSQNKGKKANSTFSKSKLTPEYTFVTTTCQTIMTVNRNSVTSHIIQMDVTNPNRLPNPSIVLLYSHQVSLTAVFK